MQTHMGHAQPQLPPRGSEAQPVAARAAARRPRRCRQARRWPLSPSVPYATGEAAPAHLGPPASSRVCQGQGSPVVSVEARWLPCTPRAQHSLSDAGGGSAWCPRQQSPPIVWGPAPVTRSTRQVAPGPVSLQSCGSVFAGHGLGLPGNWAGWASASPNKARPEAPAECHGAEAPHAAADSVKGHKGRGGAGGGIGLLRPRTARCPTPAGTPRASGRVRDTFLTSFLRPREERHELTAQNLQHSESTERMTHARVPATLLGPFLSLRHDVHTVPGHPPRWVGGPSPSPTRRAPRDLSPPTGRSTPATWICPGPHPTLCSSGGLTHPCAP